MAGRYATKSTLQPTFSTFVGIDLGGARGKTTAVARLSAVAEHTGAPGQAPPGQSPALRAVVEEVTTRHAGTEPWNDQVLIDYLAGLGDRVVVAVNAPLTLAPCLRCELTSCPGKEACVDPAVVWLRTRGEDLATQAMENDGDRIAVIPGGRSFSHGHGRALRNRPRIEPYMHRSAEIVLHYQRGLLPRDVLGQSAGPVAARAVHLRRRLTAMGFVLNENLIEVSPRATVHALFGARSARGYKRDADPWQTRVTIVEGLHDLRFAPQSRLSREEVLRNDHCFDALLSGYTAYLRTRDHWSSPGDPMFMEDGWIWAP